MILRIEKVVPNSGDLDGTYRYSYNGQQVIEVRDGSSNVLVQAYYGTQYIDEIVALKLEHGYAVVSQDANYNVTTLTDLAGRVLERVFTTEYGQPIIQSASYFGDYDADGDVDATDDGFLGSGQTCWGAATGTCRVFDFNGDGTLDASDETVMTALVAAPSTNRVHHARRSSPVGNLFLHQGLVYDAEIGAYQNRAREYDPFMGTFGRRDPLLQILALIPSGTASFLVTRLEYTYENRSPLSNLDPEGLQHYCSSGWEYLFPPCDGEINVSGHGMPGGHMQDDDGNWVDANYIKDKVCPRLCDGGQIELWSCWNGGDVKFLQELLAACPKAKEICGCKGKLWMHPWSPFYWCSGGWHCETRQP